MNEILELYDGRINSKNFIFQITIEEYLTIAEKSLNNNEFQRKKVKNANSVYTLLKEDLQKGCIIPPIVLAITDSVCEDINIHNIKEKIVTEDVIILDGLQRTLTLVELISDLGNVLDIEKLEKIKQQKIRIEVYVGLNKLGILYRMLTLNTGQTPMSLRQQTEMLYLGYINHPIDDIRLIRETEGGAVSDVNHYKFNDVIEGFNSYLERNELPIVKADILENIKSLEKLSKEDQNNELFSSFIVTWNMFIKKVNSMTEDVEATDRHDLKKIFAKNILQLFKKPQAISGFGAASGKLVDYELIGSFNDIQNDIDNLILSKSPEDYLYEMNKQFEWIDQKSKKIGNSQRMFFQYYFRELFNRENDNYLHLFEAIGSAFHKYESQNF